MSGEDTEDLCLSVDLGTGGPKVGLVTLDGRLVAQELHSVSTVFGPQGSATQDATQWWEIVLEASRRLLASVAGAPDRIVAVAITGQWASTVPVDERGIPTGPCITWQDSRGGRHVRERLGGRVAGYKAVDVARWVRHTGGAPATSGADPVGHILHLLHDEPAQAARTRWFLEPVDYLTFRLTGRPTATHASMQGAWLTDVRHLDQMSYDPILLHAVGIPADRLPPLVPIGSIIGPVTAEVASSIGLRREAQVITGLPDLQAAALGSRSTALFATHMALSTTSWISCPVTFKKTDITHSIATVPGLANDHYLVVNNQDTGAKALEWLRGILGGAGSPLGYPELIALAATSPPGAGGVFFTPWLAGERSPVADFTVRGGFTNLSLTTETADLVRSVLEGVAVNSAWLLKYVEKFCGRRLEPLRLVGGGAQSELWCQLIADALGRTVEQCPDPMYAQLRGMALMAAVALGRTSLAELPAGGEPGRRFEPQSPSTDVLAGRVEEIAEIYTESKARFRRWNRRD
jgi:xylulokinase